jgi:hypothetical protein
VVSAIVGLFVAAVLLTASGAQAAPYSTSSYTGRLLALVNGAREQHGLRPLALTGGTTTVASDWTRHLAASGTLSHNPQLGEQLSAHGSRNWGTYGENVGVGGADDPDNLFNAYMNSPEHRANILNSSYRYVGVAVVFTGSQAWNTFDFVDAYGAAAHRTTTRRVHVQPRPRPHAVAAAPAPQPVAAAPVTPPAAPPARSHHRRTHSTHVSRPAHQVAVHVKGLQGPARHVQAVAASESSSVPAALLGTGTDRLPTSRGNAVAIAAAVALLMIVARRWVLVVARRVA